MKALDSIWEISDQFAMQVATDTMEDEKPRGSLSRPPNCGFAGGFPQTPAKGACPFGDPHKEPYSQGNSPLTND